MPSEEKLIKQGFKEDSYPFNSFSRETRRGEIWDKQNILLFTYAQDFEIASDTFIQNETGKFKFRVRTESEFDKLMWQIGYSGNDWPYDEFLQQGKNSYYQPCDEKLALLGYSKHKSGYNPALYGFYRSEKGGDIQYIITRDFEGLMRFEVIDEQQPDYNHSQHCRSAEHYMDAVMNNEDHTDYKDGHFVFRLKSEYDFDLLLWQLRWTHIEPAIPW